MCQVRLHIVLSQCNYIHAQTLQPWFPHFAHAQHCQFILRFRPFIHAGFLICFKMSFLLDWTSLCHSRGPVRLENLDLQSNTSHQRSYDEWT